MTSVPMEDKFGTIVVERGRLILRIQDRFETLAPSEHELAVLFVEREEDLLTYSATASSGASHWMELIGDIHDELQDQD